MADDFKVAAINWLLTHGRCDWMMESTSGALKELAKRGVDYEASDTPDFDVATMIDDGDTFTDATFGEGISAVIIPNRSRNWRDTFNFVISTGELGDRPGLTMTEALQEIIEVGEETGESAWRTRIV